MERELKTIISMIIQDLRKKKYSQIIDFIKKTDPKLEYVMSDNWNGHRDFYNLIFYIEYDFYEEISKKKQEYENIILAALNNFYNDEQDIISEIKICPQIKQYIDWDAISTDENKESLIKKIIEEKNILVDIATGKIQIQEVNDDYIKKHCYLIDILKKICLEHVNNYNDLWAWFNDYKKLDLTTYKSRRDFLNELYNPLIENIMNSNACRHDVMIELETPLIKTINSDYIKNLSDRALRDIENGELDSSITKCRTLLEEIFCYVIELNNQEPCENGSIGDLYKQVKTFYSMHQQKDVDKRINMLLSGLEKIIASIAEMRNNSSDAHGKGSKRINIEEHHARLLLNASIMMSEFILSVANKEHKNIGVMV